MEVLYPICCGMDVHKKTVVACLLTQQGARVRKEVRTFGTTTGELLAMRQWLLEGGCAHTAMESTGIYWKPIFNVLEGHLSVLLVNAQHIKAVPGRKSDVMDCEWIAQLLRHGLLRGSFVPDARIRELRDLTRYRTKLTQQQSSVANRIQKVLEDANIKMGSVASDVLGKSGLAMIEAIIEGVTDAQALSELAQGRLKSKKGLLKEALEGRVTDHHRFLLRELLDQFKYLEQAISRASQQIEEKSRPFEDAVRRLDTLPGVDRVTAEKFIAEIGVEMSQFPTDHQLASWAGMCPGNNESAGKHKSGKTRKGSRWLRSALTEAAWAASRTKKTYLKARYHRLAARRGKKRALVAVGHTLLVMAYHILREGTTYRELGEGFFDRLHAQRLTNRLVKKLESLGHKVTLEPCSAAG